MAAISVLNPRAEVARRDAALQINIQAAKAMAEVIKGNLGPKGTMKMLVSGCGDIKITKDGNVLLQEMKIQHPTASLIAKAGTAHDDTIGDGTSSIVLFIGELMKLSENVIGDGYHPRLITDGINIAKEKALEILDSMKIPLSMDRCFLINVARSSLRTKVHAVLADHLAEICTDAVLHLYEEPKKTVDLHMIEIITMQRMNELETSLVKGLVMDHGGRHPDMPSSLKNCYILTCNVSLEYEKTEINTEFFYSNAGHREKLLASEHEFIDQRVQKIIELKKQVCLPGDDKSFMVVNQKGIDPLSLQALADEGILGLRRAKRRNMERLAMACGGMAMNSLDELTPDCLGYAGQVYEQVLGDNKFTFVEECKNPKSVTILVRGPTKYGHAQITDALRDGLRALSNAIADDCVVHGAGAVELKISKDLEFFALSARKNVGIKLFSNAILCIPKALIRNAGYNVMEMLDQAKVSEDGDFVRGLDLENGGVINPATVGIYDVYAAKKQIIDASTVVATNLLLTDEIMRAGLSSLKTPS